METRRSSKSGFTLVELLVVITIITILAALLIPAVYFAIQKAKEGRIAIELANIEKALERYKIEYGEYPPDFAEVGDFAANQTQRAELVNGIINDHLSRIFRQREAAVSLNNLSATMDLARGSNGVVLSTQDQVKLLSRLGPHNALQFWLRGFSPDPARPLFGGGARQPFFEFDKNRLRDLAVFEDKRDDSVINMSNVNVPYAFNADQGGAIVLAEYIPPSNARPDDANAVPYVYYRANKATQLGLFTTFAGALAGAMQAPPSQISAARSEPYRVYASAALWAYEWNKPDAAFRMQLYLPNLPPSFRMPLPFFSFEDSITAQPNALSGPRSQISQLLPYAAPDKFQLLTSGLGEDFGVGGDFTTGLGNMRTNRYDVTDKSTMTSMTGGQTLEDLQE